MVFERLVPGVKHRDDSHCSFKTSAAELEQRFADRFEQEIQDDLLVGENQPVKFMGQGKHQMEVPYRQKLGGLFFQPAGFSQGLALRAVSVAAGVVSRALKATRIAAIQVAAQFLGPAHRHGPDNLLIADRYAMRLLKALAVLAEDVGQLGSCSFFSCHQLGTGQRHSGTRLKRGVA